MVDDLLDGLPDEARQEVERLAKELVARESALYLDGTGFTGKGPGLRPAYSGYLMLAYLTDVPRNRVVIAQVTWCG